MERYAATEAEIGRLFGVENFFYFLTLLLAAVPITKFSRTKMALLGSVILVLGYLASAYAGSLSALFVYRAVVSIGGALITAAGTAAASASPQPERVFATAGILYLSVFGTGHAMIPHILERFEMDGVYISIALYGAVVIPVYFFLYPPVKVHGSEESFLKLLLDAPYRLLAVMAMLGLFVYELGQNAAFTFMDQLGENAGIEADSRGMMFFLATSGTVMGGGLAAWMGAHFGRFWPLTFGLVLNISSAALFAAVKDPVFYLPLLFVWDFSYGFVSPYIMGTLASLDREGRWAVAGDAFWNFSQTPGPVIAALIVTHAGYNPLAIWVLTSGAVGMTLLCFTAKQSDKLGLNG
jgi:predicted MFS family arabinose efflux permease